ncbi:alpha/beta hydrolase [Flavobacterium sp. ANB]|uniref:alpha/beta hydrolase-fold protein n=1 Tax=unclassified Flavobacterium TaxID=196869 RepID=UPI0012B83938|nr:MULTISPECIES: alpha/beta hydrolase-fold protein [unclassified Flavobacterium]MBF4518889.1 alpha/beta hydrolase [Flavobacterium sp. ANB]MTD71398.1 alpha/beta hydrolase [Flavobacterium sp. LC2016-13]
MKKDIHRFIFSICGLLLFLFPKNVIGQAIDSIPSSNQQQILLHSKSINEDRTIWIHTPPEYATSTDTYPVLYLLDGGSHFKYVSEMVDFLSDFETNFISKMIVVGIPNTNRGRDFTPTFDLKENGAEKFLGFIKDELVPYIDKNYRTQPYRILEAHSLGGLFGIYANETAPNLFQASIIISPALTGDKNREKVMSDFSSYLKNNNQLSNTFFVTIGNENTQGVDTLTKQLKTSAPKSFQWSYKTYKEENHFSVPYKSMYDGLRFIYSNWHTEAFLNPNKISYKDIENHFKKLSKAFGYAINPTEDFLNQCGYQQLRFKHIEEAIEFFKQNIRLHPDSFNVYDSMGEAYMINGQKALAIENYEKSIVINPKNEGGKEMLKKLKNE